MLAPDQSTFCFVALARDDAVFTIRDFLYQKSAIAIPSELIEKRIYLIRGQKVMLDTNLAELYGVETRALVQGVKRNLDRFPEDFMFQLTKEELEL